MTTNPEQEREAIAQLIAAKKAGRAYVPADNPFAEINNVLGLLSRSPQGEIERLRGALEWISAFAFLRSNDSAAVLAKVARGALRTISDKAVAALLPTSQEPSDDE